MASEPWTSTDTISCDPRDPVKVTGGAGHAVVEAGVRQTKPIGWASTGTNIIEENSEEVTRASRTRRITADETVGPVTRRTCGFDNSVPSDRPNRVLSNHSLPSDMASCSQPHWKG